MQRTKNIWTNAVRREGSDVKKRSIKKLSKKGVLIGTGIAVAGVAAGVAVSHLIKMMSKH